MSNEIELKIAINQDIAQNIAAILSDFHILQQQKVSLANTYYDSADYYLVKHKMGLRVRNQNQKFTMTLKTDGKTIGGLHIRPEYNLPLTSEQLDIPALLSLSELNFPKDLQLQPIFTTNFTRQSWLIECGKNSEIEIALDRGQIDAKGKILPICELEFELKYGELQDLLNLVANLSLIDGVRLSAISKAQRGYQLVKGNLNDAQNWAEKLRNVAELQQKSEDYRQILTELLIQQQQLTEETLLLGSAFFAQDFTKTAKRIAAFFSLYQYYLENDKLLQKAFAQQFEVGIAVDESLLLEIQDSHQYYYNQIDNIVRLHSQSKDNLLAMQKLEAFLKQASLLKTMINLLRLTVIENG